MNPLREWAQHNLLRALTAPRNKEISAKIFPEIQKKLFVSPRYKRVFAVIKAEYTNTGKFPSWKSLMANPALSAGDSKYLRAKEIKRRSNEKDDTSLRVPVVEEDYTGLITRLRFDSKHVSLINLHNKIGSALDNDSMTPDELEAIASLIKGEADKVSDFGDAKGEHITLNPETTRKYLKQAYKNFKNKFFIPTGFKAFDSINVGIPSSALFVILGKTGAGKSSLALNICVNSKKLGARVCLVPLEMSIDEMMLKLGSLLLREPLNELTQNLKRSFKRVRKAVDDFCGDSGEDGEACFDFYVPETGDNVEDVLNYLQPYGYDLVCIDYPKLLSQGNMEEHKALDKGAAYSKRWSAKNRCYVMWLSQMDETTESIRYSKAVMEHASNAWAISGDIEENRESGQVLIKQRKARSQVPISFNLKCDLACSYYGDMEEDTIGNEAPARRRKKGKDEEIEEGEVTTTRKNQDKSRARREKGRVKMKVGPGLDDFSSRDDIFPDVPEDY